MEQLAYNRQQNYCFSFKKDKKKLLHQSKWKNVPDYKQFWRTIKPVLSEKIKPAENIILVEFDKTININRRNANAFKQFHF